MIYSFSFPLAQLPLGVKRLYAHEEEIDLHAENCPVIQGSGLLLFGARTLLIWEARKSCKYKPADQLKALWSAFESLGAQPLNEEDLLKVRSGSDAETHFLRFAAGLEQALLAMESPRKTLIQLKGKLETDYPEARELVRLIQEGILLSERVVLDTNIHRREGLESGISSLLNEQQQEFGRVRVLFLGLEEVAFPFLDCFLESGTEEISYISPCIGKSRRWAAQFGGRAVPLSQITTLLPQIDVVVDSLYSPQHPIPSFEHGLSAFRKCGDRTKPLSYFQLLPLGAGKPEQELFPWLRIYTHEELARFFWERHPVCETEVDWMEGVISESRERLTQSAVVEENSNRGVIQGLRSELDEIRRRHVELHSNRFLPAEYEQLHRFSKSLMAALLHKLESKLPLNSGSVPTVESSSSESSLGTPVPTRSNSPN